MQSKSDAQLLGEYAECGAEAAFAEIVTRHTNLVYSAALRQVDSPDAAAEVAQSVFIGLARSARSLSRTAAENASLAGWLCRSARNISLNLRRDEFRRHSRERQAMENLDSMPDNAPDWERLRSVLDEAMAGLSEPDYDAVVLRFFKNQDLRSVGLALGMSDDTAQKRVSRALDKLRDLLSQRGIATPAVALSTVLSANAVQVAPAGLAATITAAAALAETTVAITATATVTKAIAMTTLQKTLIAATLAAAVGTGIYEARKASTLRTHVQTLQQQQAPLAEQVQQLTRQRDDATDKLATLHDDNGRLNRNTAELLKLRGEVARLREMEQQLAQLKKSIQAANETNTARMIAFGTELQDMGAATPERAASSLIWAASGGRQARVSELLELPEGVSEADAPKHYEFFAKQLSNVFSRMEFTSMQGMKLNSDGTLRLNFTYRNVETGKTNPFPFMLRLRDSGWKVVVEDKAPPNELPLTK